MLLGLTLNVGAGAAPRVLAEGTTSRQLTGRVATTDGTPVEGATLELLAAPEFMKDLHAWLNQPVLARAHSDEEGQFRVDAGDPHGQGYGSLRLTLPGRPGWLLAHTVFDLRAPRLPSDLQLTAWPAHDVEGVLLNREGEPVAGETVHLDLHDAGVAVLLTRKTDSAGRFRFNGLPGPNVGLLSCPALKAFTTVDIAGGGHELFALHENSGEDPNRSSWQGPVIPPEALIGHVKVRRNRGLEPAAGARVQASLKGTGRVIVTTADEDGRFEFRRLAGRASLLALHGGQAKQITLQGDRQATLILQETGSLSLDLLPAPDKIAKPLTHVRLSWGGFPHHLLISPGETPSFRGLPPGRGRITVLGPSSVSAPVPVVMDAAHSMRVRVPLRHTQPLRVLCRSEESVPLANVLVRIEGKTGRWQTSVWERATDAAGIASFPRVLARAEVQVEGSHPLWRMQSPLRIVPADADEGLALVTLSGTTTLDLHVVDAEGRDVEAAESALVRIPSGGMNDMKVPESIQRTDADGRVTFEGLLSGTHLLMVDLAGYLPSIQSHEISGQPGGTLTVELDRGAVLSGRVRDARGHPEVGITVEAKLEANPEADIFAATRKTQRTEVDEQGRFELTGLPRDASLTLRPTGKHGRVGDRVHVQLPWEGEVTLVTRSTGSLLISVTRDAKPVVDCWVTCQMERHHPQERTDKAGQALFERVEPGTTWNCKVKNATEGYGSALGLTVHPHERTDADMQLTRGTLLNVSVRDAHTGQPIPKAQFHPKSPETDAQGRSQLSLGPEVSSVVVTVMANGYDNSERVLSREDDGLVFDLVPLPTEPESRADVTGRVVGPNGAALAGAQVHCKRVMAFSDKSGAFTCQQVLTGKTTVRAVSHLGESDALVLQLDEAGASGVSLEVLPHGSLALTLLDEGRPWPHALVELRGPTSAQGLATGNGTLSFERLRPGDYGLSVQAGPDAMEQLSALVIEAGQRTELTLEARHDRESLRGRVHERGRPLAGILVVLSWGASDFGDTLPSEGKRATHSAADGTFVLDQLPRGLARGALRLDASSSGERQGLASWQQSVDLSHPRDLDIDLHAVGLRGRVLLDGEPLASATLVFQPLRLRAWTDASGRFERGNLTPDSGLFITVEDPDGEERDFRFTTPAEGWLDLGDLELAVNAKTGAP